MMLGKLLQHRGALAAGAAISGMVVHAQAPAQSSTSTRGSEARVSAPSGGDAVAKKRFRLADALPSLELGVGSVQCEAEPSTVGALMDDDVSVYHTHIHGTQHAAPAKPLLAGGEGLTNPGDFEDLDDNHSFRVQELDGVFLMLISMIGRQGEPGEPPPQDREPAMFQMQYTMNASTADAAFVINDSRAPSTQVMVTQSQPGMGRMLQVTNSLRLRPGVSVKTEVALAPTSIMGGNVQVKHDGPDFHAEVTVSQGQQGPTAEMSYHQAVTKQVTAGGTVAASLGQLLPVPDVKQLGWGAFGSWHDLKRDNYVLGRYDSQSGRFTGKYWHQAHKTLALGATLSAGIGGDWASNASVGAKYSLGADSGAASSLTASLTSDKKASFAWQKQNGAMSQNISNVFFQTTLSGVYDHVGQEHKLGLQIIAQY